MAETVAQRYDREWLQLEDDRKVRGFDYRSTERIKRDFNESGDADTNTTVDTLDNVPAGFNQSAFEATLEYNPNA
jgi:hypothetical protein